MHTFIFADMDRQSGMWKTRSAAVTDIELTELGHRQAEKLGKRIKEEGIKIDEILYSPLSRAAETARYISEITGIMAREEIRLKEQNFGRFESTPEMERNSGRPRCTLSIIIPAESPCSVFARGFIIFWTRSKRGRREDGPFGGT